MRKLAAIVSLAFPVAALACPSCVRDNRPWSALLIAAMIATPFLVAGLVVRIALRGEHEVSS